MDVLSSPARNRAPRRATRLLPGLMVLLVVALLLGDRFVAFRESARLVARVQAAEAARVYADRRLAGLEQYVSPQLNSPLAPAAVRISLRDVVQAEVRAELPALRRRRAAVAGVRLLPWHRAQRRARSAYLDYAAAVLRRRAVLARDLEAPVPAASGPDGTVLARRAQDALRALPLGRPRTVTVG